MNKCKHAVAQVHGMHMEQLGDYIPDFAYKLVNLHGYTNRELRTDGMNENMGRAPADVARIITSVIAGLLRRLNVPQEEADSYIHEVKGGNMGYLFENMERHRDSRNAYGDCRP